MCEFKILSIFIEFHQNSRRCVKSRLKSVFRKSFKNLFWIQIQKKIVKKLIRFQKSPKFAKEKTCVRNFPEGTFTRVSVLKIVKNSYQKPKNFASKKRPIFVQNFFRGNFRCVFASGRGGLEVILNKYVNHRKCIKSVLGVNMF